MTTKKTFLAQTAAAAIGGFIVRGRPSPSNTLLPKQLSSQLNNEYNDAVNPTTTIIFLKNLISD